MCTFQRHAFNDEIEKYRHDSDGFDNENSSSAEEDDIENEMKNAIEEVYIISYIRLT